MQEDDLRYVASMHADGFYQLSPALAKEHIYSLRVVDVREPDEFEGLLGHIRGAELIPLALLNETLKDWQRDKPLLLVCHAGGRAAKACIDLSLQGFTHVFHLEGGMLAWTSEYFEVEGQNDPDLLALRDRIFSCFIRLQKGNPDQIEPMFHGLFDRVGGDFYKPTPNSLKRLVKFIKNAAYSKETYQEIAEEFAQIQNTLSSYS